MKSKEGYIQLTKEQRDLFNTFGEVISNEDGSTSCFFPYVLISQSHGELGDGFIKMEDFKKYLTILY